MVRMRVIARKRGRKRERRIYIERDSSKERARERTYLNTHLHRCLGDISQH